MQQCWPCYPPPQSSQPPCRRPLPRSQGRAAGSHAGVRPLAAFCVMRLCTATSAQQAAATSLHA